MITAYDHIMDLIFKSIRLYLIQLYRQLYREHYKKSHKFKQLSDSSNSYNLCNSNFIGCILLAQLSRCLYNDSVIMWLQPYHIAKLCKVQQITVAIGLAVWIFHVHNASDLMGLLHACDHSIIIIIIIISFTIAIAIYLLASYILSSTPVINLYGHMIT